MKVLFDKTHFKAKAGNVPVDIQDEPDIAVGGGPLMNQLAQYLFSKNHNQWNKIETFKWLHKCYTLYKEN